MTHATLALIGAGHMGKSLLLGLIAEGYPATHIWVTDQQWEPLTALQKTYPVHITQDNTQAVAAADIIILAVKPQVIFSVLQEMAPIVQKNRPLVISIAAGIEESSIEHALGENIPVIRCMPNMPAQIRCGVTVLHANAHVTAEKRQTAEKILSAIGTTLWVEDEKQMDVVTALSGSGPAYFFLFIESLIDAGVALGLSSDMARILTLETAYGAIQMAKTSEKSVSELRQQVTSKGGTTEKALAVFAERQLREMIQEAVTAATHRSYELAQLLKNNTGAST